MKLSYTLTILYLLTFGASVAQSKWKILPNKPYLTVGTSLTYIPDKYQNFGGYNFHEFIWSVNISVQVLKRYHQGIDYLKVVTYSPISGKNAYSLVGVFGQIDFLSKDWVKIYGEFGYYTGNYCTCGGDEPFRKKGLNYTSLGGGAEFRIANNVFLDFAFINKTIINVSKQQYHYRSFNLYIIGINTRIR